MPRGFDDLRHVVDAELGPGLEFVAGGGSIDYMYERGVIGVGTRIEVADPGPACYCGCGYSPRLTVANLLLGYIDCSSLLGGRMELYR